MMFVTLLAWVFALLFSPIVVVSYLMDKRVDVRDDVVLSERDVSRETFRPPRPRKIGAYYRDRS